MHKSRKILFLSFFALVLVASLPACAINDKTSSFVSFTTEYAPIEFQFPSGWFKNKEEHPYDLQCFSRFEEMNTGVFVFRKMDLAADATPLDIFWAQVDDIKSKRKNFEEFESLRTHEYDDKTLTTATFLGDLDSRRFCYRYTLIQFKGDDSIFCGCSAGSHTGAMGEEPAHSGNDHGIRAFHSGPWLTLHPDIRKGTATCRRG